MIKIEKERKLAEEEVQIYLKQKQRFEDGLSFFNKELEILKYKLDCIAPHEYFKELENLKKEIKTTFSQIKDLESKLKIINKHLTEGVEVMEEKKNG